MLFSAWILLTNLTALYIDLWESSEDAVPQAPPRARLSEPLIYKKAL
jgi:hypothetical protein